jgi:hypothetical protein
MPGGYLKYVDNLASCLPQLSSLLISVFMVSKFSGLPNSSSSFSSASGDASTAATLAPSFKKRRVIAVSFLRLPG